MIRESLILGTVLHVLRALWGALAASPPGRWFEAVCRRIGGWWRESLIVSAFCAPRYLDAEAAAPGRVRARLCALYGRLRLEKLFSGSIFLQSYVWCALGVAVAPFAPTMAVLGLALVGCASLALRLLHEGERRLVRCPLALPVLAYAALYLLGLLTSVDRRGSLLVTVLTVVFVLFSPALYHAVETRAQLDVLTALMVAAGAAVSCYGILQYRYGWGYQSAAWVDADMFTDIRFRVGATMENPNMLGQYLTMIIPLGGAKLLAAKDWRRRLWYLACCGVMCVCMILTFSRGAWLGLLFAGAIFFIAFEPRLLVLVPVGLAALYVVLPDTVVSRFTSIGNMTDRSTSYRVSIWLGTLAMLRDGYWLTGIGPGEDAFNSVYPFYCYHESVAHHSHNLFLQIVCDAGIAELAVFLWVLLRYFRTLGGALLRGMEDRASRLLTIAFASGAVGFLVQAMTDYSFYNYRVMFLFWSYLALGLASARRDRLAEGGILA